MKETMKNNLVIVGAGGHGKVVAECAELMQQWETISFYDDKFETDRSFEAVFSLSPHTTDIFIAIGNNQVRESYQKKCEENGFDLPLIMHPQGIVSKDSEIGKGTVLMAGAIVNPGTIIGRGCILNTASSVDHDCTLDNFIHVAPGARLSGTVTIKERTWVGVGAVICENRRIGSDVMIAAGAVVIDNIENDKLVKGVPAK